MEEHELGVPVSLRVEVEDVLLQLVLGVAPQPRRTSQRRRLKSEIISASQLLKRLPDGNAPHRDVRVYEEALI